MDSKDREGVINQRMAKESKEKNKSNYTNNGIF